MKLSLRLAIALLCLCFASSVWAKLPVTFQITGITDKAALKNTENILDNMLSWLPIPTAKLAVDRFVRRAPKQIQEAMQPYGYYHPKVNTKVTHQGDKWVVHFNIHPGPTMKISRVNIQVVGPGKNDPKLDEYLKKFPLKHGDTLLTETYRGTKIRLIEIMHDRGYFKAKLIESKIVINLNTNTANINYKMQTGKRYRFGETKFSATPFALSFLKKYIVYKDGEYYDRELQDKSQKHYTDSAYFAQSILTPEIKQIKGDSVPIYANLTPLPRKEYLFGLGYGTDTGPRGTIGINLRYVNPYGHQFSTLLQASQKNSQFFVKYLIPGSNPATDAWTFTGSVGRIIQTSGQSNLASLGVSYSTVIWGWKQLISLTYLKERYNFKDLAKSNANLLYPSINWQRRRVDDELYPSNGYNLTLNVSGTPSALTKLKTGFFQAVAELRTLTTLHHTRVLLHGEVGRTDISKLINLPLSLQLFTGGSRSIRSFSYNAIGPGKNLVLGSIEIQQRIKGKWYLGAFYDVGNVADDNLFRRMRQGVGPSIVWLSPVGVLQLGFANAISEPGKPWKIFFSMGPSI